MKKEDIILETVKQLLGTWKLEGAKKYLTFFPLSETSNKGRLLFGDSLDYNEDYELEYQLCIEDNIRYIISTNGKFTGASKFTLIVDQDSLIFNNVDTDELLNYHRIMLHSTVND